MKFRIFHLFFLFMVWVGCSDRIQEKVISLGKEFAKTSLTSTRFDSLVQEVNQLPTRQRVKCLLQISDREEETVGILKQEQILRGLLPVATKGDRKKILFRLIAIYNRKDCFQVSESRVKGIGYIQELEEGYSLTREEKWDLDRSKASFLNQQGKQGEYLPIWLKLLKEHRAAGEPKFVVEDLCAIATHLAKLGDNEKAIAMYKEAVQLSIDHKFTDSTNLYFSPLARLLCDGKQYREVIAYYQKADDSFSPSMYNIIIDCYLGVGKTDSARCILKKRLALKSQDNLFLNNRMAESYIIDENIDSASLFLEKALTAFQTRASRYQDREVSLPMYFLYTYSMYAELLQKYGKMQQAELAYKFVEPLMETYAQGLNWKEKQIRAITGYSVFCRHTNQYEKALELLARRDSLLQVYNKIKAEQESNNLVHRFEMGELTHQIETQEVELEYSKMLNTILVLAGLIATILLTMLYGLFKNRRSQFLKLYQQYEQLQKLEGTPVILTDVPDSSKALYLKAEKKVCCEKLFLKHDLSIESLSELLNTNRTYLSTSINECTGKSYSVWINDFRVKYVIKLMHADTTLNTKSLASQCGFSSNETFYKNFKQRCGVTPGQYLNQIVIEQGKAS